jgi:hypothetical protein
MAVLTAERSINRKGAESTATIPLVTLLLKAATKIYKGGLVATDATGYAVSGAGIQATGLKVWGIALKSVDNTAGASGALTVDVIRGTFPFANLGGDLVVQATMGSTVFCEDDQTVRLTSNASTRSNLGVFMGFDEAGLPLVQVGNFSQTGV